MTLGTRRPSILVRELSTPFSIDQHELLVFFGIVIYMDVWQLPSTEDYWGQATRVQQVVEVMSCKLFSLVRSLLHFTTTGLPGTPLICSIRSAMYGSCTSPCPWKRFTLMSPGLIGARRQCHQQQPGRHWKIAGWQCQKEDSKHQCQPLVNSFKEQWCIYLLLFLTGRLEDTVLGGHMSIGHSGCTLCARLPCVFWCKELLYCISRCARVRIFFFLFLFARVKRAFLYLL